MTQFISKLKHWSFLATEFVMERLNELSVDEKKVFHSILSHEDNNKIKNYSNDKVKEMLLGMSYGLDFDLEKILLELVENK